MFCLGKVSEELSVWSESSCLLPFLGSVMFRAAVTILKRVLGDVSNESRDQNINSQVGLRC